MATTGEKKKSKFFGKHDSSFWGTYIILTMFWILINWRFHYQHLIVGLIAAYFIAHFNKDIIFTPKERPFVNQKVLLKSLRYGWDMIIAIFKSNIDVAMVVLSPKMPISPGVVKFRTGAKKDVTRVVLANSITLTPGTLTLDVVDDHFVIHCLTRENAEDVANWDMEKKLLEIEKAGS